MEEEKEEEEVEEVEVEEEVVESLGAATEGGSKSRFSASGFWCVVVSWCAVLHQ